MKPPMELRSRWVLVTGASSGLGLEMARQLARDDAANLVLVARRGDRLDALAQELTAAHGVAVHTIVADLSDERQVERVFHEATAERELYGAILNAGITHFGEHLDLSWQDFKRILDTNVNAVAQLTHALLPYLIAKQQGGGVMLVASMSGVIPVPYQAAYTGTKAFLLGFGHSLWHELEHTQVSLTTFVPGGIATEMTENAGLARHFGGAGLFIQSPADAARDALSAFRKRKHTHVPGVVNQAGVLASKLLPRRFVVGRVASEYRRALARKHAD